MTATNLKISVSFKALRVLEDTLAVKVILVIPVVSDLPEVKEISVIQEVKESSVIPVL